MSNAAGAREPALLRDVNTITSAGPAPSWDSERFRIIRQWRLDYGA
jgi:hypothetical protein